MSRREPGWLLGFILCGQNLGNKEGIGVNGGGRGHDIP